MPKCLRIISRRGSKLKAATRAASHGLWGPRPNEWLVKIWLEEIIKQLREAGQPVVDLPLGTKPRPSVFEQKLFRLSIKRFSG